MQPGARVIESPRLQKDSSRGAYAHTFFPFFHHDLQ